MSAPDWVAQGVPAYSPLDEDSVYHRLQAEFDAVEDLNQRRANQSLDFPSPVVTLVFTGDHHLGAPGSNLRQIFSDAELVMGTKGMYMITLGDLIDNFVLMKLRKARDNSRAAIVDEWALFRRYLRLIRDKYPLAVGGNHDNWDEELTGIDWSREVIGGISGDTLYDSDDCRVMLTVGGVQFPGRVRHKWKGYSIYNPLHGIMRAAMFDQDFTWGVGGHTHSAGVFSSFNAGGRTCMAVQVGTYKRYDRFPVKLGMAKANPPAAMAIMFDSTTGSMTGFDNLELAAQVTSDRLRHLGQA